MEAGADDYLVKPFDYDILIARIEALTRRNLKNKGTQSLSIGAYSINLETLKVTDRKEEEIHLSTLEFSLLKYFAQNKNRVLSRQELYEKGLGGV